MSKQTIVVLTVALVSVLLIGSSSLLYNNAATVNNLQSYIKTNCKMSEEICLSIQNALRPLLTLSFEINNQKISKETLPSIHLYLSDGALKQIDDKRNVTLAKTTPILFTDTDDWVKGQLIADDGLTNKETPVSLRLKGDWGDHLSYPSKLSFRINPKGSETVMGMSRFSIQHPATRHYYFEPMLMNQMRDLGILAPRYFFAHVWINDYPIGLMAVEEHFTKELLESQGRREGSIIGFNEDPIWNQWDLNYNTIENRTLLESSGVSVGSLTHQVRDFPLKDYRSVAQGSTELAAVQSAQGLSLLKDYLEGTLAANQVFDMKQFSPWWISSHIWGACHGVTSHNRRFYFNTITTKLEPIVFDGVAKPDKFSMCADELDATRLFSDPIFLNYLFADLEKFTELLHSESYINKFKQEQEYYRAFFDAEGLHYLETDIYTLQANLRTLINNLITIIPKHELSDGKLPTIDNIINTSFLKSGADFNLPLRSYVFFEKVHDTSSRALRIDLKNLSLDEINVEEIYFQSKKSTVANVVGQDFSIGIFNEKEPEAKINLKTLTVDWVEDYPKNQDLRIKYTFRGESFDQPILPQFNNHDFISSNFLEHLEEVSDKIIVQESQKTVIFPKGNYVFNENYYLPLGWTLLVMPDSELAFKGVSFKLQGSLIMIGEADEAISIDVETDTNFKGIGIWGGLYVVQSEKPSRLEHVHLLGHEANLLNRQDYLGLTGCLTFFESDVEIYNSSFKNAQCEDALNIVRSTYKLHQVTIDASRADAFDSDFSTGHITNSHFLNIGNDGVDISGTTLSIDNSKFTQIGDKAISVGEKSNLTANSIVVNQASTGVASKDLSTATLSNMEFTDIKGTGLITYIKKPEYGPASIQCSDCTFNNSPQVFANQSQSSIVLNNEDTGVQYFNQNQLVEIGYIEK